MAMFFLFGPRKNLKFFSEKNKKQQQQQQQQQQRQKTTTSYINTQASLQFIFIFDIQRRFQIQQQHPLKHFFHGFRICSVKDKFFKAVHRYIIYL